jgi:amino acid adenylation domain-containing protein
MDTNNLESLFPLTLPQLDIYYDQVQSSENPRFNIGGYLTLPSVDLTVLKLAHKIVVENNDAFGIRIISEGEEVNQYIARKRTTDIDLFDLSAFSEPKLEADKWLKKQFNALFETENAELFRAAILKLADDCYYYFGIAHHLIMDGWGFANWANALSVSYQAIGVMEQSVVMNDNSASGPILTSSWEQVCRADVAYLDSIKYRQDKAYWQGHSNSGDSDFITKKKTENSSSTKTEESGRQSFTISYENCRKLDLIAKENSVSLAQIFQAIVIIYLNRYYTRNELVIGVPLHNRRGKAQKRMIGVFTNVSPFKMTIDNTLTVIELCQAISKNQRSNLRHQRFPISHLKQTNRRPQETDAPFAVDFNYLKMNQEIVFEGQTSELNYLTHHYEATPLSITVWEGSKKSDTNVLVDFNYDYFDSLDICYFIERIQYLINQIVSDSAQPIRDLSIVPTKEASLIKRIANESASQNNGESFKTLHSGLTKIARQFKDKSAIVIGKRSISYGELDDLSNKLAIDILTLHKAKRGDLIGVCLPRTIEHLIAIIAISKAECVFFPIDFEAPVLKIESLLKDSGSRLIFSTSNKETELEEVLLNNKVKLVTISDFTKYDQLKRGVDFDLSQSKESGLAYVIYTSGSTGKPKGVMVEQKAIGSHISDCINQLDISDKDQVYQIASFSFDTFLEQTFAALSVGATLHVSETSYQEPEVFFDYLEKNNITVTDLTPAYLVQLTDIEYQKYWNKVKLDRLVVGGEALSSNAVSSWFDYEKGCRLFNAYGPTECVVTSTLNELQREDINTVSIGKPIGDRTILILDKWGECCPIGSVGEIYIAGNSLANGYWNNPKLTSQMFLSDFHGFNKVYRTGDLGFLDYTGKVYFSGRKDSQLKIRGYRVELGEIESVLNQFEKISDSAVKHFEKLESGDRTGHLVAFIVLNQNAKSQADLTELAVEIRDFLSQHLPSYMIPESLEFLDKLPLTKSQKVDRKALLEPKKRLPNRKVIEPKSELEIKLRVIWSELLEIDKDKLSLLDNFFELGGHSLLITKMIHRMSSKYNIKVPASLVFRTQNMRELAASLEKLLLEANRTPEIIRESTKKTAPLSASQFRIWFVEQLNEQTNENNISGGVKITGQHDLNAVKNSLSAICNRHEILRTVIVNTPDGPVQEVSANKIPSIDFIDKCKEPEELKYQSALLVSKEHALKKINLLTDSLVSFLVIKLDENSWLLSVRFHHIVCDGWSLSMFVKEFVDLYEQAISVSFQENSPINQENLACSKDSEVNLSYLDYARWQQRFARTEAYQQQKFFWRDYLKNCNQSSGIPIIERHSINARTEKEDGDNRFTVNVDLVISNRLHQLAKTNKTSLFSLFQSSLSLWLSRLTGESDILIGVPVSGRNLPGTEEIFGSFVNNLPVRSIINLNESFESFFVRQSNKLKDVFANQDLPFEEIIRAAELQRNGSKSSVLNVFLNFLNIPQIECQGRLISAELLEPVAIDSKFDLTLYVDDSKSHIEIECVFNQQKYSSKAIKLLVSQYISLLEQVASSSELKCGDYSFCEFNPKASHRLPSLNDNLPSLLPKQRAKWCGSVHQIFEQYASTNPEHTAIEFDGLKWSYKALNLTSSYFASQLIARGIRKQDVIAIMAERSDLLVIAVLAIFKAGGAYIMLSSETPAKKLNRQIETISPRAVITLGQSKLENEIVSAVHQLDSLLFNINDSEVGLTEFIEREESFKSEDCQFNDVAYVALSSGTEGLPKVIEGRHGSLTNFMSWMAERFELSSRDRFGMLSGLLHDPLQRDMFTPLCLGGTICIPSKAEFEFSRVDVWLEEAAVSVVHLTPSLANYVLGNQENKLPSIKAAFFAGEQLNYSQIESFADKAPNVKLVNLYGSTETSRAVSYYEPLSAENIDLRYSSLPVGKGIDDTDLVILNDNHVQCGVGELGEIGIRSHCLTRGYKNDPLLTETKFISNPASELRDDVIYLSGDMGRYLLDGNVVFEGRKDRQIKVRGFRVELAEIEAALLQVAPIENVSCLVSKNNQNEDAIVAFVVLTHSNAMGEQQGEFNNADFKSLLKEHLPNYMIPTDIVVLEAMPLTVNGKLDTKQLRSLWTPSKDRELQKPNSSVEKKLLTIWKSLLGRKDICVLDNFFDIGGHSLLVTKMFSLLKEEYQVELEYKEFFKKNSIREIATSIEQRLVFARKTTNTNKKQKITI